MKNHDEITRIYICLTIVSLALLANAIADIAWRMAH